MISFFSASSITRRIVSLLSLLVVSWNFDVLSLNSRYLGIGQRTSRFYVRVQRVSASVFI
ncbi:MAG: hypothetical protein ACTSUH_00495 [Candidatus Thorarchaeota archaeon]